MLPIRNRVSTSNASQSIGLLGYKNTNTNSNTHESSIKLRKFIAVTLFALMALTLCYSYFGQRKLTMSHDNFVVNTTLTTVEFEHDNNRENVQWFPPLPSFGSRNLPPVTHEAFLDMAVDGVFLGRIVIGVFGSKVPKASQNFIEIAACKTTTLCYRGMRFHRIIAGFVAQGGDIVNGDGTGSVSIYGDTFADELDGLKIRHDRRYLVNMANAGPDTNGSQFCLMLGPAPHLNQKHVVFGRVLAGFGVVDAMEQFGTTQDDEMTSARIEVVECNEIKRN